MNEYLAAHHEAAHAVVAVKLGLPLQDTGLRLDTVDGGITFNLHRKPGDPNNAPSDIEERERSIVMIKAGYRANLKLFPGTPATVALNDRAEEIALLDEMHPSRGQKWMDADRRLTAEAQRLVDELWDAIRALAERVLAKPIAPRSHESFQHWCSPHPNERFIDGHEIATILSVFGLNAIVRNASQGNYLSPEIHP